MRCLACRMKIEMNQSYNCSRVGPWDPVRSFLERRKQPSKRRENSQTSSSSCVVRSIKSRPNFPNNSQCLPLPGLSILLIPFSFDFVDALCISTVLGFLCESINRRLWSARCSSNSKVAISATLGEEHCFNVSSLGSETERGLKTSPGDAASKPVAKLPSEARASTRRTEMQESSSANSLFGEKKNVEMADETPPRPNSLPSLEETPSQRPLSSSPKDTWSEPSGRRASVHWGLALVAAFELALSMIRDRMLEDSADSDST